MPSTSRRTARADRPTVLTDSAAFLSFPFLSKGFRQHRFLRMKGLANRNLPVRRDEGLVLVRIDRTDDELRSQPCCAKSE
jgi:hypothetical protein